MKPTISKGLGALTPETWGQIYAAVQATSDIDTTKDGKARAKTFTATIDSSTPFTAGTAKWKYSWTEKRRNSDVANVVTTIDNPRTGSDFAGYAVNLLELSNTAATAYGFAVTATELDSQPGFFVGPVPNGTVVEITMRRAKNGSISYEFMAPNRIDGACPVGLVQELDGGEYGAT
jgi:hypothetical protein